MNKVLLSLLLLFLVNCVSNTILIKSKKIQLDQFDIALPKEDFPIVEDKEKSSWLDFKKTFNFFRVNGWVDDSYSEYSYKFKGQEYNQIFACLNYKESRNANLIKYSKFIFRSYEEKINRLEKVSLVYRRVFVCGSFLCISISHCFIITGSPVEQEETINNQNQSLKL